MANTNILPKELIESLENQREELNAEYSRRANVDKIRDVLSNKQLKLSTDQIAGISSLKDTLESDNLQKLEDKAEANNIAQKTLGLLDDIKDNTENLKFDFGRGKEGIVARILTLTHGLLYSTSLGIIQGMKSIFKFETFPKIFKGIKMRVLKFIKPVTNLLSYISRVFSALNDVYKKAGTGRFLKGDTWKIFRSAKVIKGFNRFFKAVKNIIEFVSKIGESLKGRLLKLKGIGSGVGGSLKDVRGAFMQVWNTLKPLSTAKGPISGIVRVLKTVKNAISHLRGAFRLIGTVIGKLVFPLMMVYDFISTFIDEFKTTEYENLFMKILDSALAGIGGIAGGFIGGLTDLIKDGLSLVADKLGFEGLSEWLDSFSIEDMVKEGFSNIVDMFDMLFTRTIPAIISATTAALIPGGKSFNEAFEEAMYGVPDSASSAGAKADTEFIEANDKLNDIEDRMATLRKRIDKGAGIGNWSIEDEKEELAKLLSERGIARAKLEAQKDRLRSKAMPQAISSDAGFELAASQEELATNKAQADAMLRAAGMNAVSLQDASVNNNNSNNSVTITPPAHADRTVERIYSGPMMAF